MFRPLRRFVDAMTRRRDSGPPEIRRLTRSYSVRFSDAGIKHPVRRLTRYYSIRYSDAGIKHDIDRLAA